MNKELELNLELEFTSPDPEVLARTEELIFQIGSILSPRLLPGQYQLNVPESFLRTPLTESQRIRVDNELTLPYADQTLKLQDIVARVPIIENFESFIHLPTLFDQEGIAVTFSEQPFHEACGDWGGKARDFWVRASVGRNLATLSSALNSAGLKMKIEDAFRPMGVQEGLFKRRVEWTRNAHPEWNLEEIVAEARSKTAVTPRLASHKGGAAVDMTLQTIDGKPLDLGNNYPQGGALVVFDFPYLTQEQWTTRQIFAKTATFAGFTVYPGEDWHISLGDNLAFLNLPENDKLKYSASYGPIKEFSRETGEIIEIYHDEELDRLFPVN